MLRSLRTFPLFEGYWGRAPLDAGALEELLIRVSQMGEDIPQLSEIDLNPVLVSKQGYVVIDDRMKITPSKPLPPRGARTVARQGHTFTPAPPMNRERGEPRDR